jgi:acyl-CoA dehydrogenase
MGVTALMLPESCGGHGMGALELCVVAEEIGRQNACVPLASSLYLAAQAVLLGSSAAQQQEWLTPLSTGAIATLAAPLDGNAGEKILANAPTFDGKALNGKAALVVDGAIAQIAVVLAKDAAGKAVLVLAKLDEANGVARRTLDCVDNSKPYAELTFANTAAVALDGGKDALQVLTQVRYRAAVLVAFEQLGGADMALEISAAYARERKAFGKPIGVYQGIKHKLADMFTANQLARAHCYYGAWAINSNAPELAKAAAGARVTASNAFTLAAQESIQTHGGMGFTWEVDCQLFYKRARQLGLMLGSVHEWREILARELQAEFEQAA